MGLLKAVSKNFVEGRKAVGAAKTKARQEVKASAKDLARREKLLQKFEKDLLKQEQKGLKKKRKHELDLAKLEYKKRKEGRFNKDIVTRYLRAGRAASPVLIPLVYRGITQLREQSQKKRARKAGLSTEQLAQFNGHGADLQARIHGLRNSLKETKVPVTVRRDAEEQLKRLSEATDNAEFMTVAQRRRAHSAINRDIDSVSHELQKQLRA